MIKKGIILAGGKGTRFYPVTLETPKPLITVKKKPLINYSMETFAANGITDVKVIIRIGDTEDYRKWMKLYGDEFTAQGISIDFIEEPEAMGTFGFIAHRLGDWMGDEDVAVTNSDDIKDVDLRAMHRFHREKGGHATIALTPVPNAEDYGAAILEGDRIKGFLEKQKNAPSNIVSIGMYIISPAVAGYAKPLITQGERYIMIEKDIFPAMAAEGKLFGYLHRGVFKDCGTLEKWRKMIEEG